METAAPSTSMSRRSWPPSASAVTASDCTSCPKCARTGMAAIGSHSATPSRLRRLAQAARSMGRAKATVRSSRIAVSN